MRRHHNTASWNEPLIYDPRFPGRLKRLLLDTVIAIYPRLGEGEDWDEFQPTDAVRQQVAHWLLRDTRGMHVTIRLADDDDDEDEDDGVRSVSLAEAEAEVGHYPSE